MNIKDFQQPQRQSVLGIIFIFSRSAYKFFKAFWGVIAVFFINKSLRSHLEYIFLIVAALLVLLILYSIFYYLKFQFFIDEKEKRFVLNHGVFSTESLQIPFDKIQQVDLKRSILQRFIGVYGLSVDTAGSSGDEINIRALSHQKALALSDILTRARNWAEPESSTEGQDTTDTSVDERLILKGWVHRVSFWTLIKIGLSRSYFRGFGLMLVFVSTILNQLQGSYTEYLEESTQYLDRNYGVSSSSFFLVLVLLVGLTFVLSVLVTVGEVIIRHFGLEIRQTAKYLQVEMGLKTNTKVSFQPRRLQVLRIMTNPIQKYLNLFELRFSLASSQNNMKKNSVTVPGLSPEYIAKIKYFLYPDTEGQQMERRYRPRKNWPNRRYYILIGLTLGLWVAARLSLEKEFIMTYSVALGVFLVLMMAYHYAVYKTIALKVTEDFLVIEQGFWTQGKKILECYKMQGVSVRQPFWYKRRKIYNLTFHTAGGDITIRAMPESFLKELNYLLYKVESSQKPWM